MTGTLTLMQKKGKRRRSYHATSRRRGSWEFFRAPLAGVICMHRDLGPVDALSVGKYLQTLLLACTSSARPSGTT